MRDINKIVIERYDRIREKYSKNHIYNIRTHFKNRLMQRIGIKLNRHEVKDLIDNLDKYKLGKSIQKRDGQAFIYWVRIRYRDIEFWVLMNYHINEVITALPGTTTRNEIKNYGKT